MNTRLFRNPALATAAALLLSACSDRVPTLPADTPGELSRTRVDCVARVQAGEIRCGVPAPAGPSADVLLGGQGLNVRLVSSGTSYDAVSHQLTSQVTVQNLLGQELGTPDGVQVTGVNVFFAQGPTVQAGSGNVSVTADSVGIFTAGNQPYYHYHEVVAPRGTTQPRTWTFAVDPAVEQFAFTVYVDTRLRDENGVLRWTRVSGPVSPYTTYAVWGSSANDVFAVGATGVVQHFDGSTWTLMARPTAKTLSVVAGSGPRDVWAAGTTSLAHYDGNRWTLLRDTATGLTQTAIGAPQAGHAWLVGYRLDSGTGRYVPVIRHTGDTGATWNEMAPADSMQRYINGMAAETDTHVWTVGSRYNGQLGRYEGLLLRTEDGGQTWTQTVSTHPAERILLAVWSGGAGEVFVAGEQRDTLTGTEMGLVLRSQDGGATWSETTFPHVSHRELWSVWSGGDGVVYAGGRQKNTNGEWEGVLFRSADHGATWTPARSGWMLNVTGLWGTGSASVYAAAGTQLWRYNGGIWAAADPAGPVGAVLNDTWSADGKLVLAVGSQDNSQGGVPDGVVARSTDGGATWSTALFPAAALNAVWGTPSAVWAVGSGSILRSTDGGASWADVAPPTATGWIFNGVWANATGAVFVAGIEGFEGLVLRSSDGGATWQRADLAAGPTNRYPMDVWGISDTELWVSGAEWDPAVGASNGWAMHSSDGGVTWTEHSLNGSQATALGAVWAAPGGGVYAAGGLSVPGGQTGVLLHSADGTTWTTEPVAAPAGSTEFTGIWGTGPNSVYVAGGAGMIRHWNGSTWTDLNSGTRDELLGIYGVTGRSLWVVGANGTILHGIR